MEHRPLRCLLSALGQKDLLFHTKYFPCSTLKSERKDNLVQGLLDGCIDNKSRESLCSSIIAGKTNAWIVEFWRAYRDSLPYKERSAVGTLSSWGKSKAAYTHALVRIDEVFCTRGSEPGAKERAASCETARPSPAREGGPRDCDQAQATETALVQHDAHKNIWWANLGGFFKASYKKKKVKEKKAERQRKTKATRQERGARVRAAIMAELEEGATCDIATLRARVSTQVGFSLEGTFGRYLFEKKLKKAIQGELPARKKPRSRFKLAFSTSRAAPKKNRQPQATATMRRRARTRC